MKRGIFVAPFGELSDPHLLAGLAAETEQAGWDGFFLWDHVVYKPPVTDVADPWIALTAAAMRTERITLGPLITPLPRRRTHQLARETTTLDRLSGGRLVLGVGIGTENTPEFDPAVFGEEGDMKARGQMLDDGLAQLKRYWEGEFQPRPVNGTIPIWVAARWPNKKPLRRAGRHDGLFPIDQPDPGSLKDMLEALGPTKAGYDVVVTNPAGTDPEPWVQAGATWCLNGFGIEPTASAVRAALSA